MIILRLTIQVGMTDPWRYRKQSRFQLVRMNRMKLLWAFIMKEAMTLSDMESCLIQDSQHQEVMNEVKYCFKG